MRFLFLFIWMVIGCSLTHAQVDAIVPFTSSNLPIVVINASSPILDDPKITADMGIIDNWPERNDLSDPFNVYDGKIGIEIRGSSSQMFPKKQYGIELQDDLGEGIAASLLGMPEEEDWVLFAPYNDKSLMRDALAYALARSLGGYAPRTRFCEVVLNGVYQGIYVLIEKIKRDKNRVDINKLDPDEITGNDLSGGYIIKIDKFTGGSGDGWNSEYQPPKASTQQIFFQYEYPDAEEIVAAQESYIQQYVSQFEDALHGNNFDDPLEGYAKFIDVNSFVDYFIMQEITKNVDGYRLSTFLYKQRESDGGKLFMGPVWDFNLGFGNANYCTSGNPEGFVIEFNNLCEDDYWLIPFWWKRLLQDEAFGTKVAARWAELRGTKFTQGAIHTYIDSVASVLNAESQQRNFTAWNVLNNYVWPNYFIGSSFQAEVDWLKAWVLQRVIWLDQNMPSLITATEKDKSSEAYAIAYPNPFSSAVTIDYWLVKGGEVSIKIFDGLGRVVTSTNTRHTSGGKYSHVWFAEGSVGLYSYSVEQGSQVIGRGKLFTNGN